MPPALADLGYIVVLALAALATVAAYLLSRALIYIWPYTLGAIFDGLAKVLPGGWRVLGHTVIPDIRGAWRSLEKSVYDGLLNWNRSEELALAWTWHQMGRAWRWQAAMVEWLAHETDATFEWLLHARLPKWTEYALLAPLLPLLIPKLIKALIPYIHATVVKPVTVIERTLPGKTVTIVRRVGAQAIPDVWHLPGFPGVWHGLTRRFARIHWRLSRLEKLLTATGLAAVMAAVLGVTTSCLRRGNVGKTARRICGMDTSLLDALLLDGLAIVGTLSVVEFAEELRAVEDEAVKIMGALVTEWPS